MLNKKLVEPKSSRSVIRVEGPSARTALGRMPSDQHAQWMLAFQQGNTDGFTAIVEAYRIRILHYLYRCVRDYAAAEELAQEVFLRVFRTRNYQATAKFSSWLFRIATNLAINWARDHRRDHQSFRLNHQTDGRVYELVAREASIENRLMFGCVLNEVRAAIEDLSPRSRAAVLMHKYEGMEYEQIAQALDCSIPALKSLLFRAYEILRERLRHLEGATGQT